MSGDGDLIRLDAAAGTLDARVDPAEWDARGCVAADLSGHDFGTGRELFAALRATAAPAERGGGIAVLGGVE